jgi:uncharacterized protein YgiM (DUF1202 family)
MKRILALACATISFSALAEDVWVNRPALDIREGKGAAYNLVVTAKKGDKLSVVGREGKWVKVNLNGKEGYVFENSLSATQVAPESMSNMSADAKAMTTDAAAKGLEPESLDYAKKHNYSDAGLEQMKKMRKLVTGKDFEQFTSEGKVGPAK